MKKATLPVTTALVKKRRRDCVSTSTVNSRTPLLWQCALGHRWSAVLASIRKGNWCPDCAGVRRRTLEQMQQIATFRGGICLSESYRNNATKLGWRCSAGHRWNATPLHIKRGHWCPFCAKCARLTLDVFQRIALQKGGHCLSREYLNSSSLLRWRCGDGHEWLARPSSINAGTWCPRCARNQRLKLEEMQEIAKQRSGNCLSIKYKNGRAALLWECNRGHRWRASPANVKSGNWRKGTWCPKCYNYRRHFRAKRSIEEMRTLAMARGGVCISSEYVSSKTKLIWQCAQGHRWQALPTSVVQGTWCPLCAHNQPIGLSQLQEIATSRGGLCLSEEYLNERTALLWRCSSGHKWKATPSKVKRGSWCPLCAIIRRRSKWTLGRVSSATAVAGAKARPRSEASQIQHRRFSARARLAK
jgi:hypothetical protein